MSGVISEGGERLRVFLDGKTRATKPVKRGPKIAHATSSRQLRKRSRAMRSIAPSSCAE
jgi:hypothetical protein